MKPHVATNQRNQFLLLHKLGELGETFWRMSEGLFHEHGNTGVDDLQRLLDMQVGRRGDHGEARRPIEAFLQAKKPGGMNPGSDRFPARRIGLDQSQMFDSQFLQIPKMPAADRTTAHHQRSHFRSRVFLSTFAAAFVSNRSGLYSERNKPIQSRSLY